MKTLIIGAGPLGSLYTYLFHKAGKDVTLLARGEHYQFLQKNGLVLINEFTQEKITKRVNVIDRINEDDEYDLVIILMRKNSVKRLLPTLGTYKHLHNILFMGNNTMGFREYLEYLPKEKILFGFPGGGGSRIDHIIHFIDSEKPRGPRMPITLGEIDGQTKARTQQIKTLFESASVPVKIVDDMDSWLKYHVAFVLPVAGALLKSGDNYQLAYDKATIREYVLAVREAGRVLKALDYHKSYNPKFKLFYWFPVFILIKILSKVFNSKFAEVAMMMHVKAAQDEMAELAQEFRILQKESGVSTPFFDKLMQYIYPLKRKEEIRNSIEMSKEADNIIPIDK